MRPSQSQRPGVIEFLERMRRKGVKMAIATLTARRHAEKALLDRGHDAVFLVHAYDRGCGRAQIRTGYLSGGRATVSALPRRSAWCSRTRPTPVSPRTGQAFSCAVMAEAAYADGGSRAAKRQRHLCRALVRASLTESCRERRKTFAAVWPKTRFCRNAAKTLALCHG